MAGKRKQPAIPDLDRYIGRPRGRPRRKYITYEEGAKLYRMPYWSFVRLARRGGANYTLRKTAVVDVDILDAYLKDNYEEMMMIIQARRYLK